jgi:hypothetical protein
MLVDGMIRIPCHSGCIEGCSCQLSQVCPVHGAGTTDAMVCCALNYAKPFCKMPHGMGTTEATPLPSPADTPHPLVHGRRWVRLGRGDPLPVAYWIERRCTRVEPT